MAPLRPIYKMDNTNETATMVTSLGFLIKLSKDNEGEEDLLSNFFPISLEVL